jgi:hypothetical protein
MTRERRWVEVEEVPLPDTSVAELFEIGSLLVRENQDLPAPFELCDIAAALGELWFQLKPEPASVPALVAWALRFGGVLEGHTGVWGTGEPHRWVQVSVPFQGVLVLMYARVPVSDQQPVVV